MPLPPAAPPPSAMVAQGQTQCVRSCLSPTARLDCPAELTTQPLDLYHPQLLVILPDGHAALVEVEQASVIRLQGRSPPAPPEVQWTSGGAGGLRPEPRASQAQKRSEHPNAQEVKQW